MKILIAALLAFFSLSSFAECFTFINGQGPQGLGTLNWAPYKAQKICFNSNGRIGGSRYESVEISDLEGAIVQMAVALSTGRCGPNRICLRAQGQSGNFNGANLRSNEARSLQFSIDATAQRNIGRFTGTFTDLYSGKQYLIMK